MAKNVASATMNTSENHISMTNRTRKYRPRTKQSDKPHELDNTELVLLLLRGTKIPRMDGPFGKVDPYVHMWLESYDGEQKTEKISWPYKIQTKRPVWNTARDFGKALASDWLVCDVFDWDRYTSHDYIGQGKVQVREIFDASVNDLVVSIKINCKLWRARGRNITVDVKLVYDPEGIPKEKTLFLVRHGESKWNKAQSSKNLVDMWGHQDHPLNETGIGQAKRLQQTIEEAVESGGNGLSELEKEFLSADLVCSSPLTRALQTCVIATRPIIERLGWVTLLANAREKRNFGGKDSSGKVTGSQIKKRCLRKMSEFITSKEEIQRYSTIDLDLFEVKYKWWLDQKEEKQDVALRMNEFLMQLRYFQHERIILCGHSHFFRQLFKQFMEPDPEEEKKKKDKKKKKKKKGKAEDEDDSDSSDFDSEAEMDHKEEEHHAKEGEEGKEGEEAKEGDEAKEGEEAKEGDEAKEGEEAKEGDEAKEGEEPQEPQEIEEGPGETMPRSSVDPKFTRLIKKVVVENCGVLAVKLRYPEGGNDLGYVIQHVELLFGTNMKS